MIAVTGCFVSQIQRLVSFGLFSIVLFISAPALAESDRKTLFKLQDRQNIMTSELRTLQNQVRSVNPTTWEVKALQFLIQESNCLRDRIDLESNILNRSEFAIILERCFKGLEKVATANDPDGSISLPFAD